MNKEEKIIFKRTVKKTGGSLMFIVPPELAGFIDVEPGQEIEMTGDKGKHGKFIAIWKGAKAKKKE